MGQVQELQEERARLRRALWRWRVLAVAALAGVVVFGVRHARRWVQEHALDLGWSQINRGAPHAEAIAELIRPLRYSGLHVLHDPTFHLSIDPAAQTWTAHQVHRFDADGQIALHNGRFGICGDLSASIHGPLRELFDPQSYTIEFVRAAESQFFPASLSAHYVLRVLRGLPPAEPEVYILDPSFHRYGPLEDFDDYIFYEPRESLEFMKRRSADETMPVGTGMPLVIHSKYLLALVVGRNGRQFSDTDYRLSVVMTMRYRYAGRNVLSVRRHRGASQIIENRAMAKGVLSTADYDRLRARVLELFDRIRVISRPSTIPVTRPVPSPLAPGAPDA